MASMIQSSLERTEVHRYPIWVMILVPLLAISLQTRLVLLFPLASSLDLALLVTVYFASNRRNQLVGLLMGAVIGLAQDALGSGPIGVFGIVMTLIGYLGSSLGGRIDVDNPLTRLLLVFGSYYLHFGLYYILVRGLLDRPIGLPGWTSLISALGNALLAVVLFHLLDRLRTRE
jgi:rod shape-determining protein MreD